MSLALDDNPISNDGFFRRKKLESLNRSMMGHRDTAAEREGLPEPSSSSSSSIGKNSDDEDEDDEEEEVESKLKNNTFDSSVDALEQALPMRKGISNFYNGKSKSFASLSDAACTSMKEIAKPENPYTRKRKNLLAYSLLHNQPKVPGIPKRPISSSRSTLALTIGSIDENDSSPETSWSNDSRNSSESPPSSPQMPWRSFSLVDLQHCALSVNDSGMTNFTPLMGKRNKPDEVS